MENAFIITTPQELTEMIRKVVAYEFEKLAEIMTVNVERNAASQENQLCFIEDASKITGLAISTIRTKCHLGKMPYFKPIGTKKLQFNRLELLAWMSSGKVKTIEKMEMNTNNYLMSKKNKKNL